MLMWFDVKKFKLKQTPYVNGWQFLVGWFGQLCQDVRYILNTPNFVSSMGAFKAALKLNPSTLLESTGSITPSSHILNGKVVVNSTSLSL